MNAYQRQLLDKLINELTDKPSSNLHAAQMLAAELKGAMQAQAEIADMHPITCDCAECVPNEPTPDADGWVENTGAMPECKISKVRFRDGNEDDYPDPNGYDWSIANVKRDITHYRPA